MASRPRSPAGNILALPHVAKNLAVLDDVKRLVQLSDTTGKAPRELRDHFPAYTARDRTTTTRWSVSSCEDLTTPRAMLAAPLRSRPRLACTNASRWVATPSAACRNNFVRKAMGPQARGASGTSLFKSDYRIMASGELSIVKLPPASAEGRAMQLLIVPTTIDELIQAISDVHDVHTDHEGSFLLAVHCANRHCCRCGLIRSVPPPRTGRSPAARPPVCIRHRRSIPRSLPLPELPGRRCTVRP